MSKNMTRKGLAFGAGVALVASGLAAAPAQAVELNEGIPLAPTSGPASAYAIYAADGATFSVTASPISTAMAGAGTVKFLVSDPSGKFLPDGSETTGGHEETVATGATVVTSTSTDYVSVVHGNATVGDGAFLMWAEAALIADIGGTGTNVTILPADTLVEAYVKADRVFFKSPTDLTTQLTTTDLAASVKLHFVKGGSMTDDTDLELADEAAVNDSVSGKITVSLTNFGLGAGDYVVFADAGDVQLQDDTADDATVDDTALVRWEPALMSVNSSSVATITIDDTSIGDSDDTSYVLGAESLIAFKVPSSVRASDNSYVVDTGIDTAGTTASLALNAVDAAQRTVTVQAFVDDFANNEIDTASEYTSKEQTITFATRANVAWTTALKAPAVGDRELSATMTSVPMINGAENDDDSEFKIAFTRQGSPSTVVAQASQIAATGTWSASVTMETGTSNLTTITPSTGAEVSTSASWADLTRPGSNVAILLPSSGVVDEVVTIDTNGVAHNLKVGDLVTISGFADGTETVTGNSALLNDEHEVTAILSADQFQFALADAVDDAAFVAGAASYDTTTYDANPANGGIVDRVFPGDYSAQAAIEDLDDGNWILSGNKSTLGTLAAAAADTVITTEASATVQGKSVNNSDDTATDVLIKSGTLAATVTATVVDKDGDAVGAGRAVTYTVTRSSATTRVNGLTTGTTLTTDANGQVTFAVTDTLGAAGTTLTIAVTPEGVDAAKTAVTLAWAAQAYTVVDLNTTADQIGSAAGDQTEVRTIGEGQSYVVNMLVADQWFTPAASDTYRVVVSGQGVTEGIVSLTDGKGSVTISDAGVDDDFNTVLTLQKLTSGVWGKVVAKTINTKTATGTDLLFATDGSSVYEATAADLSDAVAAKALVERDTRVAYVAKPAYANAVTITGKVIKKTSSASQASSVVTISGPSNILFEHGSLDVAKRGSLTFIADATNGTFAVDLYSTTAQKDTVITVTANGYSETIKVTFTGIGVGEGTSLVVTAPAAVKPASTFQVKAKLSDVYGNGVDTAAGRMKVTYTGPGIVFGTLPTETDANGELMFSVLLGSNDTGNVVVTVSYDQNGDGDYVDAKDLNTTSTTAITATGVAAGDKKVNAGSFKGYVALYARGYEGQRMSAKVGNDWVVVPVIVNNQENGTLFRAVEFTGAGYTIAVRIYIDRVLVDTITVTTK